MKDYLTIHINKKTFEAIATILGILFGITFFVSIGYILYNTTYNDGYNEGFSKGAIAQQEFIYQYSKNISCGSTIVLSDGQNWNNNVTTVKYCPEQGGILRIDYRPEYQSNFFKFEGDYSNSEEKV